jgi:Uma2 family endonuclease
MVDEGILGEDERVELLDGELLVTPPQGPPHAAVVAELDERLRDIYGPLRHVRAQCPLGGAAESLPEPDLAVVRGRARDFVAAHPTGAHVVLVIEVARTSQAVDRWKAQAYAKMGVPVYWLIDLGARRLEVRSEPEGDEYRSTHLLGESESAALPETAISWTVRSLLP